MRMRVSDVIKPPVMPRIGDRRRPAPLQKHVPPIRASELVKRRHAEAVKALEKAIEQREEAFIRLAKIHTKIWKLARQVQRYERLVP